MRVSTAVQSRFTSFALVGAVTTAMQFAILALLAGGWGVAAPVASAIGYCSSALLNYALNRRYTYASDRAHAQAVPRFVGVALGGLALNTAVVASATLGAHWHYLPAQALATAFVIVWGFVLHGRWTFGRPSSKDATGSTAQAPLSSLLARIHYLPWLGTAMLSLACFYGLPWTLDLAVSTIALWGTAILAATCFAARWFPPVTRTHGVARHWLVVIIVMGVLLRIAWILVVPPIQFSDTSTYVSLARGILNHEGYHQMLGSHDLLAYRAPGYAFMLAGAMVLFGDQWWTPAVLNLAFVVASALLMNDLATRLWGGASGVCAVALFMAWPSGVLTTGMALTEYPSLFLLLLVAWAIVRGRSDRQAPWWLVTGLGIGVGALVRPSILLLPAVLLVLAATALRERASEWRHVALAILVAALCIAPWTLRNQLRLGAPVLISTNGGDNLYRANNPLASGGFTPVGEKDFSALLSNEVEWDRASREAAKAWIVSNPLAFARLMVRKVAIGFGDDSGGAFALSHTHRVSDASYGWALAVSNLWWVAVWMCALMALIRHRAMLVGDRNGALLLWLLVLLPAVHAVFEAQPRYHMPMVGVLLCLCAALCGSPPRAGPGNRIHAT